MVMRSMRSNEMKAWNIFSTLLSLGIRSFYMCILFGSGLGGVMDEKKNWIAHQLVVAVLFELVNGQM